MKHCDVKLVQLHYTQYMHTSYAVYCTYDMSYIYKNIGKEDRYSFSSCKFFINILNRCICLPVPVYFLHPLIA
jgi:hypothetical protein